MTNIQILSLIAAIYLSPKTSERGAHFVTVICMIGILYEMVTK